MVCDICLLTPNLYQSDSSSCSHKTSVLHACRMLLCSCSSCVAALGVVTIMIIIIDIKGVAPACVQRQSCIKAQGRIFASSAALSHCTTVDTTGGCVAAQVLAWQHCPAHVTESHEPHWYCRRRIRKLLLGTRRLHRQRSTFKNQDSNK